MSEPKVPFDGQYFFDPDVHTTSATPPMVFSPEDLQRAHEAMKSLPSIPRVEFFKVPGTTDVAVVIDGDFAAFLTEAEFAELKAKLEGG